MRRPPLPSLVPFPTADWAVTILFSCPIEVLVLRRSERYACPASMLNGLVITPGHWAHGKRRRTAIPRSDTHLPHSR